MWILVNNMKKIKIFIAFSCAVLCLCLCSCVSENKVEKLYSELKPFALKNDIIMNDNNHVFLNGNDFYLKGGANYEICYSTINRIYFVEHRNGVYLLKSVDHNGKNEKLIQEVGDYIRLSPSGELYQIVNDNYYFYQIDEQLKLKQIINENKTAELDEKLYGNKKYNVKYNNTSGFIYSSLGKTIELTTKDIHNVDSVGKILKNYDLKAYSFYYYGDTLYFNFTIKFGSWDRIFLCFKYENDKLTFVDACEFNVDSIELTKFMSA